MPVYKENKLGLDVLLLDPNNYRFQETKDFVYADPTRFHEEGVQERAYKTLKDTPKLAQLKASILRNGFIPVERLDPGLFRWAYLWSPPGGILYAPGRL